MADLVDFVHGLYRYRYDLKINLLYQDLFSDPHFQYFCRFLITKRASKETPWTINFRSKVRSVGNNTQKASRPPNYQTFSANPEMQNICAALLLKEGKSFNKINVVGTAPHIRKVNNSQSN